jgi:hypothetical protein
MQTMSFQITALDPKPFEHLFDLTADQLKQQNAVRVTANESPGFPCRVSLMDANIGDTLILVNHQHLNVASPYAATHAIYVRQGVKQAQPPKSTVPDVLATRLLSIRAFDKSGMMQQADVVDGQTLAQHLPKMFENPKIAHIDIHNAKQGCFAARAHRMP